VPAGGSGPASGWLPGSGAGRARFDKTRIAGSGGPVARTAVHLAPTAIHLLVRLPVSIRRNLSSDRQTATTSLVNGQVNGYHEITVIRTAGTPSRLARRAPEPLTTVAELEMRLPMPEELPDPVNLYTRVQRRPLPGLLS
jgi:hypothetical protein